MKVGNLLRRGGLGLGLFFALLAFYLLFTLKYLPLEKSSGFVCALFLLPLLHFLVTAAMVAKTSPLRRIFLWTIGLCSSTHFIEWGIYANSLKKTATSDFFALSGYSCIWLAAALTLACFIFTGLTMYRRLDNSVKYYPFLSINFFVASFMYLIFFLTFSIAFLDRGPHRALYVEDLTKSDAGDNIKTSPLIVQDFFGYFFFEEGSATVELDESYLDKDTLYEALYNSKNESDRSRVWRKHSNAQTLNEMIEIINKLDKDVCFDILLCGHANERELSTAAKMRYQDNRGLAGDRASWVETLITRKLPRKPGNVTKPLGSTGDQYVSHIDPQKLPKGFDPKLLVEVAIRPQQDCLDSKLRKSLEDRQKKLELLDYLYFITYTITTTGYGDMIPISPEAKFITIMANLLEVFYLVIFFNIILASIRPGSVYMRYWPTELGGGGRSGQKANQQ
jgi:hypothetical protein